MRLSAWTRIWPKRTRGTGNRRIPGAMGTLRGAKKSCVTLSIWNRISLLTTAGWPNCSVAEGRNDEALHEVDVAHANDPLWPVIFSIEVGIAAEARRFPRSVEVARRSSRSPRSLPIPTTGWHWALFEAGQYDEALAEWRTTAELDHDQERIALEKQGLEAYQQGGIMAYAKTSASGNPARPSTLDNAASE